MGILAINVPDHCNEAVVIILAGPSFFIYVKTHV